MMVYNYEIAGERQTAYNKEKEEEEKSENTHTHN